MREWWRGRRPATASPLPSGSHEPRRPAAGCARLGAQGVLLGTPAYAARDEPRRGRNSPLQPTTPQRIPALVTREQFPAARIARHFARDSRGTMCERLHRGRRNVRPDQPSGGSRDGDCSGPGLLIQGRRPAAACGTVNETWPTKKWEVAEPAALGLDADSLKPLAGRARAIPGVTSILCATRTDRTRGVLPRRKPRSGGAGRVDHQERHLDARRDRARPGTHRLLESAADPTGAPGGSPAGPTLRKERKAAALPPVSIDAPVAARTRDRTVARSRATPQRAARVAPGGRRGTTAGADGTATTMGTTRTIGTPAPAYAGGRWRAAARSACSAARA